MVKLLDFVLEWHTPYSVDGQCGCVAAKRNLLTNLVVDKGEDVRLLMCLENGEQRVQT